MGCSHILLVDDDPFNIFSLELILETISLRNLSTAENGLVI